MARNGNVAETSVLLKVINEAILEKKGVDLVNIKNVDSSVAEYFVIVTANSKTMASTIASYVEKFVQDTLKEKAWKKEGYENCEWILLDYFNIVVHVFLPEARDFYRLEALWADGERTVIE